MAEDIISTLDSRNFNEFKKDFSELIRVTSGINEEYSKLGKEIDKYKAEFKKLINLFNKKYKNIVIRLRPTAEELKLRVFIKEKGVKDVFLNVASKLNGLRAIGADEVGKASIEETDRFSKELDKVRNKMFISYFEEGSSGTIFLEHYKKGMVELHCDIGECNERSPEFRLCGYYAVKDGVNKVEIYERLAAMGFTEMPTLDKVRNFLKKFNPRMEE